MHFVRFEIEKKLKAAKRKEQHKKKSSHKGKRDNTDKGLSNKDWGDKDLDKDVKERSKERKKTVEENKGRTDKKAQAMNALKARREEKKERGTSSFVIKYQGYKKHKSKLFDFCVNRGERETTHGRQSKE